MTDLIADILARFTELASEFADVSIILGRHGATGSATAMDAARQDLVGRIADVKRDTERLTVDQFASLHHTTPSTVKRWIAAKTLDAEPSPAGYLIRRVTKPPNMKAINRAALSASASDAHAKRRARETLPNA